MAELIGIEINWL